MGSFGKEDRRPGPLISESRASCQRREQRDGYLELLFLNACCTRMRSGSGNKLSASSDQPVAG